MRGRLVFHDAEVETVEIDEEWLIYAISDSDLQSLLRAQLPAALTSLARGDAAPLIHAVGYWQLNPDPALAINVARRFATDCVELPMPWAPDAPLAGS